MGGKSPGADGQPPNSDLFRWLERHATPEAIAGAVELSDVERSRQLIELASRGAISNLEPASLARFSALVTIVQDRRALGLPMREHGE
jgi:hypothetical protein